MANFETSMHRIKSIDLSANKLDNETTVIDITAKDTSGRTVQHTFFSDYDGSVPEVTYDGEHTADDGLAQKIVAQKLIDEARESLDAKWQAATARNADATERADRDNAFSFAVQQLAFAIRTSLGRIAPPLDSADLTDRLARCLASSRWTGGCLVTNYLETHGVTAWLVEELDSSIYDAVMKPCRWRRDGSSADTIYRELAYTLVALNADTLS
jgi:hypothetical protein